MTLAADDNNPADERILDATLAVLARDGVAGVSIRNVASEAGVAVGLAGYYFDGKTGLICAALERIGRQDLDLVAPLQPETDGNIDHDDAAEYLANCLRRAVDPAFLDADYLSLRLQLWSLAGVDGQYAKINQAAQQQYLQGLAQLLATARPELGSAEIERRSADILIEQNGIWLTAILIEDEAAVERAIDRCLEMAFY